MFGGRFYDVSLGKRRLHTQLLLVFGDHSHKGRWENQKRISLRSTVRYLVSIRVAVFVIVASVDWPVEGSCTLKIPATRTSVENLGYLRSAN